AADRTQHLLVVSARSEEALRRLAGRHGDQLAGVPDDSLADYCFTTNAGRRQFAHRLAISAGSAGELRDALDRYVAGEPGMDGLVTATAPARSRPSVAFLFTGQTGQHAGMGTTLYATQPTFRSAFDACQEVLSGQLDAPLLRYLDSADPRSAELSDTRVAQPALFALEYALAQLWISWGVRPAAVAGHSLGEYVAACVAGSVSLPDALTLVAERARL